MQILAFGSTCSFPISVLPFSCGCRIQSTAQGMLSLFLLLVHTSDKSCNTSTSGFVVRKKSSFPSHAGSILRAASVGLFEQKTRSLHIVAGKVEKTEECKECKGWMDAL